MIRWIVFLSALLLIAMTLAEMVDIPGNLVVDWLGWHVETTPFFAILLLGFGVILLLIMYRFVDRVIHLPQRLRSQRLLRAHQQGLSILTQTFAALAVCDLAEAEKLNEKVAKLLPDTAMPHLLAAQIATFEGDDIKAAEHLRPLQHFKETRFLAVRGLMLQARKSGDLQKAIALAEETRLLRPDSHFAALSLVDIYVQQKRWQEALQVLRKARKFRALSREEIQHFTAMIEHLHAVDLFDRQEVKPAHASARFAHRHALNHVPYALLLATLENRLGRKRRGFAALRQTWSHTPHPALATMTHSLFSQERAEKRLKYIVKLTASQPKHFETHLAIAEAALAVNKPATAQSQIKAAITTHESKRACQLMIACLEQQDKDAEQIQIWQERAIKAHDDATWMCTTCHTAAKAWQPHCQKCEGFDTIKWKASAIYFPWEPEKPLVLGKIA